MLFLRVYRYISVFPPIAFSAPSFGKFLQSVWSFLGISQLVFRCPKMKLQAPESKNGDHFFTTTSPQNDGSSIFGWEIRKFSIYWPCKRAFSSKWWQSNENAQQISLSFFLLQKLLLYMLVQYKIYQEAMIFCKLVEILVHCHRILTGLSGAEG